jgi:rubrerythrin
MASLFSACEQSRSNAGNSTPPVAATNENQNLQVEGKSMLDAKTRQALLDALADERKAEAMYEAVIAKFGDVRPFSNIVNAERRHSSFLMPLFEKYAVEVPKNAAGEKLQVPGNFAEACKQSVEGEKLNIAMYDKFLEFVKEDDIRETFTYLRDASKNNHLPAFERCSQGRGRGRQN